MKHNALTSIAAAIALASSAATHAGTVTSDGADLVIKTKGGLKVSTADKKYSVSLGGRIQYDYNRAEENGVAAEDDFGVRRARLFVKGDIADWSYKAQFNIGNGNGGSPEDLYIRYNGFGKKAKVTVGRQKMPFGLEELTSSKDITVLERSAITEAYAIGREDGIQLSGSEGDFTYAVAAFEVEESVGPVTEDDFDVGFAARTTFAPVKTDSSVVHLGVAYQNLTDDTSAYGLEFAVSTGSLHGQIEYVDAEVANVDLDGYYVQVGYILTGETRPYKGGKFKRVKPQGDNGAVELVVRYEDGDGNYSDIELGNTDASAWGIGVNWYLNNNIRLGMNYTDGEDNNSNDEGDEFRARIQLTF